MQSHVRDKSKITVLEIFITYMIYYTYRRKAAGALRNGIAQLIARFKYNSCSLLFTYMLKHQLNKAPYCKRMV